MKVPLLSWWIRNKQRSCHSDMDEDIFNAIVTSRVLVEEDLDFISFHRHKFTCPQVQRHNGMKRDLIVRSSLVLFSAIALANVSNSDWIQVSLYLIPFGVLINALKERFHQPTNTPLQQTERYLKVTDDLVVLVKKCFKFIQEMEIASLGYTLAYGSSTVSRMKRIHQSTTGRCFDLRYNVLNTCIKIIDVHREASLKLIEVIPDCTKLNAVLCQIPSEELGPCFKKDSCFEDICSASDELCLQFLRDTFLFMRLQQSEFLKVFVLSQHKCDLAEHFFLMERLSSTFEDHLENLEKVYQIQCSVSKPVKDHDKEALIRNKVGQSVAYKAIHSIQVHLRAALELAVQSEVDFIGAKDISNISDILLPQLLIHLGASNQCVSEALSHLNKDAEPEKQPTEHEPSPDIVNLPVNRVIDSSLLEKHDSYCEDQVFEAIVEESESANDQNVSSVSESEENRRKRIEETHRVMKELKSVLHVKTSVEERELRKSKLFPHYVPKKVTSDSLSAVATAAENGSSDFAASIGLDGVNDETTKYSAEGEMHEMLPVIRRPKIPRPNCRRRRTHCTRNDSSCDAKERGDLDSECESKRLVGIGFSSSIAHQAVMVAQAKSEMPGWRLVEETTFGESDSDS